MTLGILEHRNSDGEKGHNARVTFYKEGDQWKAFRSDFNTEEALSQAAQSFPEEMRWTVCFDGREYGSLASKNPRVVNFYKDVGTHQIASEGRVPTAGKPSATFSGWPGGLTYRPLVLSSRANCADPGGWRPAQPSASDLKGIRSYLQKEYRIPAARISRARITANKSYASQARGAKLISVNVAGIKALPDPGEDGQNRNAWFYVEGGEVRYLGSDMLLVDAGDYDGDGKEEVVFKIQRYNNDGYALYYDGFEQKAEFGWGYH